MFTAENVTGGKFRDLSLHHVLVMLTFEEVTVAVMVVLLVVTMLPSVAVAESGHILE